MVSISLAETHRLGYWSANFLFTLLPANIVERILCMHPPAPIYPQDKLVWNLMSSGSFSVDSVVEFLRQKTSTSMVMNLDKVWSLVWKWKGLTGPRHVFGWLVMVGYSPTLKGLFASLQTQLNVLDVPRDQRQCFTYLDIVRWQSRYGVDFYLRVYVILSMDHRYVTRFD